MSHVRGLLTEDLSPDPCFLSIAVCLLLCFGALQREESLALKVAGKKDSSPKKKQLTA